MTKDHIIIGFGRWGKIIFENIQNKNFFKRIYIKSRNQQFVYDTINKTLTIVAKNILKRKFLCYFHNKNYRDLTALLN